jgi:hypothetical protein
MAITGLLHHQFGFDNTRNSALYGCNYKQWLWNQWGGKKIFKNYITETISKVCITHDKNSGHNTSTCTTKPKETEHEDTTQGKYPPPLHTFSLNC